MTFFLGTHMPSHLTATTVPLFVSRRRLADRKTLPRAAGPWALDSGGFTELSLYGGWQVTVAEYVEQVRRFIAEMGQMLWAAPQDWMCEPIILARTGLTVAEHQERTVHNFLSLRATAPEVPWVPVLQGWGLDDYLRCIERYAQAGVSLESESLVGLGTVCRRQGGKEIAHLIWRLSREVPNLHAFGLKLKGLEMSADLLASADSLAWSSHARHRPPLEGCSHSSCANCLRYALQWRARVLSTIQRQNWNLFTAQGVTA